MSSGKDKDKDKKKVEPLFRPTVQTLPQKNGDSVEMLELRTGWMVKEGNVRHSWKRRFFVLQGGPLLGRLDYFKGERTGWKGALSLVRAEPAETMITPPKAKGLICFTVRTPTRKWFFGVETEEERCNWIAAINTVISRFKDPSLGPIPIDGGNTLVDSSGASLVIFSSCKTPEVETPTETSEPASDTSAVIPDYTLLDPHGDRRRHEDLKRCEALKPFVERERALRKEARVNNVPIGRHVSVSIRKVEPKKDASSPTEGAAASPKEPQQTDQLSELLIEWGEALAAHAKKVSEKPIELLDENGNPVLAFEDEEKDADGTVKTVERDVRYVLLAYSEAFDKTVAGINRKNLCEQDVDRCKAILDSWAAFLREISSTAPAETLAVGASQKPDAENPVSVLSPELTKKIAQWAVPALTTNKQPRVPLLERSVLAQIAMEKSFVSRHIQRLLDRGPIRFGFMTVCIPARDVDDFSKQAGRVPRGAYMGALPEGRLFCELTHESMCFTSPEGGDEVVIPLLWIRKLDVETNDGCFLKYTRYLSQPSCDAMLESRILYADNSPETYAWLSDITRAFTCRQKFEHPMPSNK